MNSPAYDRLARQVAHATGSFEHVLLGRSPTSVSVVADGGWMVVHVHEPFTAAERRLAADAGGAARVREFHRYLFENSLDALLRHVLKTFTTQTDVDLFLLGRGLPALGVPVNAHLHANGTMATSGNGAARR